MKYPKVDLDRYPMNVVCKVGEYSVQVNQIRLRRLFERWEEAAKYLHSVLSRVDILIKQADPKFKPFVGRMNSEHWQMFEGHKSNPVRAFFLDLPKRQQRMLLWATAYFYWSELPHRREGKDYIPERNAAEFSDYIIALREKGEWIPD